MIATWGFRCKTFLIILWQGIHGFGFRVKKETLAVYLERYGVSKKDIRSLFYHKKIVREPKEELKLDPKNSGPKEFFLYSQPAEEGTKLEPAIAGMEELQIVSQELEQKMMACTKQKGQNEDTMPKPEKPCWTCQTLTTKNCSKCSFALYCNKDCQTKDWILHKFFCASFPGLKNIQENPEDEICIGLLLPESSTLPVFVQVPKKSGKCFSE